MPSGAEMLMLQMVKGLGLDPDQIGQLAETIINGHQRVLQGQALIAQGLTVMLRQQAAIMQHLDLTADDAAEMLARALAAPQTEESNGPGNSPGNGDGGNPGGSGPG